MEVLDIDRTSSPMDKTPYPKGVFFIMATELSERFSYYGMRAVLTIYMRNVLSFSENTATSYYHVFLMLCYGLPLFWGIISDSWLGKYKTIFYVSMLFAIGNMILALSSIPPLHLPTRELFFLGLLLMAIGTAGMKPCVAPLGGEQFKLPEQGNQLKHFFSIFFFVVTIGNMISTIITPIFRRDVECFGMENCYPLAFGVPAATMIIAIITFACGKRLYVVQKPNGNMLVRVSKCVAHAITNRGRRRKSLSEKRHWLDSASDIYDDGIIQDTKSLFRVLPYFLPVPMFFALYEQLGSRWTLQATRMNGRIGDAWSIKPDQMQVSNAILMFVSLPFFNWVVYPIIAKFGFNFRTLQKMVIGGILAAMSFGVAGIVELKIQPSIRHKPTGGETVLSVSNDVHCPMTLSFNHEFPYSRNFTVAPETFLTLPAQKFENYLSLRVHGDNCIPGISGSNLEWQGQLAVIPDAYQTLSITQALDGGLSVTMLPFEDDFKKSKDGNARVKFILIDDPADPGSGAPKETLILLTPIHGGPSITFSLLQKGRLSYTETEEIEEDEYNATLQTPRGSISLTTNDNLDLYNGGSYNLLIYDHGTNGKQVSCRLVEITPPNKIHILWLLPQYILMAWGEILFIVSGMEFAYTEAPPSMKSVVQAIWHLMNAFGNIIVIVSAQNHGTRSQALEFFIFAGLMFLDSIIYGFMSLRYKYVGTQNSDAVFH